MLFLRNYDLFNFLFSKRTTIEQLKSEMNQLDGRIEKLKNQLNNPNTPKEIKSQMGDFLQVSSTDLNSLKEGLQEVEKVKQTVAEYFCEDPNSFKLEECFKIFSNFCQRLENFINKLYW